MIFLLSLHLSKWLAQDVPSFQSGSNGPVPLLLLIFKNEKSMRLIICLFSFMCVSHVVYCQTENVINSILEEALVHYFNIQDSIRMKNNIVKQTDRFVCMEGFPLGYDFEKNDFLKFHDGSYYAIKKLKKHNEKWYQFCSCFS